MFRIASRRPISVFDGLTRYLDAPAWSHALHVVPLLAAMDRADTWPPPPEEWPAGLTEHLVATLSAWSAFRSRGSLEEKLENFDRALPGFVQRVGELVDRAGAARLADVPEDRLGSLGVELQEYFWAFGPEVKAKAGRSVVLPSKLAHLLFPAHVPAYDLAWVQQWVIPTLLPNVRGARRYGKWLELCWWALRQLRAEGRLETAGVLVLDRLVGDWAMTSLEPRRPRNSRRVLALLDSYVAEYTLIGLANLELQLTHAV